MCETPGEMYMCMHDVVKIDAIVFEIGEVGVYSSPPPLEHRGSPMSRIR